MRKAIEQDAKAAPDVQLLMNDSQNDQSKQNDQIDVLLAKGVKALAINLVDPAAAGTVRQTVRLSRRYLPGRLPIALLIAVGKMDAINWQTAWERCSMPTTR